MKMNLWSNWESLGLSSLEQGPKHVGAVIAEKMPNRGAIKNLLRTAWQEWPTELAIEDIDMAMVPYWVQIRGVPLNFCSEENIEKMESKIGEVLQY
ncbi:hypothetical protein L3X38_043304 [Prunus dulcis]|uniref:DUF4283 domain-containing protein n=1 Tax=Prunus dulcis TaxID=3755 RepID=A0AAD4UXI6_PRUDU|nr:hypothetical protein L3X38_043304 [Prunus dulcis]